MTYVLKCPDDYHLGKGRYMTRATPAFTSSRLLASAVQCGTMRDVLNAVQDAYRFNRATCPLLTPVQVEREEHTTVTYLGDPVEEPLYAIAVGGAFPVSPRTFTVEEIYHMQPWANRRPVPVSRTKHYTPWQEVQDE